MLDGSKETVYSYYRTDVSTTNIWHYHIVSCVTRSNTYSYLQKALSYRCIFRDPDSVYVIDKFQRRWWWLLFFCQMDNSRCYWWEWGCPIIWSSHLLCNYVISIRFCEKRQPNYERKVCVNFQIHNPSCQSRIFFSIFPCY